MRVWNLLLMGAVALGIGPVAAQDVSNFVVDGDRKDWGGIGLESLYDVVPDTNSTIDIDTYNFGHGSYYITPGGDHNKRHKLFAFIFSFLAPPFQGSEETTVELFFDLSLDPDAGERMGIWRGEDLTEFRPDYCIGVSGRNGTLTEFHKHYVAGSWKTTASGADITELEVALAGDWLEGAIPWSALGNPEPDPDMGYRPFHYAVRTSQGESHDYLPNPEYGYYKDYLTIVEPMSWGRIKRNE